MVSGGRGMGEIVWTLGNVGCLWCRRGGIWRWVVEKRKLAVVFLFSCELNLFVFAADVFFFIMTPYGKSVVNKLEPVLGFEACWFQYKLLKAFHENICNNWAKYTTHGISINLFIEFMKPHKVRCGLAGSQNINQIFSKDLKNVVQGLVHWCTCNKRDYIKADQYISRFQAQVFDLLNKCFKYN